MDEKLKALWAKFNQDAKSVWTNNKIFFIIFGVVLLVIKFRNVIIDLLLSSAKQIEADAKKEDSKLASQENQANTEADKLVQQAQEEPAKQPPVDVNWYKK